MQRTCLAGNKRGVVGVVDGHLEVRQVMEDDGGHGSVPLVEGKRAMPIAPSGEEVGVEPRR